MFCAEKEIENKFVKEIMEQIDSDNSNTISACEFFEAIVNNLQLADAGIDVAHILTSLKFGKDKWGTDFKIKIN